MLNKFTMRSSIKNSQYRFSQDKEGRVAFLGGSITQMKGWRDTVCEYLQSKFQLTKFDFINAGIASTDTALAPYRINRDVFSHGKVDLLFVEFAVNDEANGRDSTESIRGMEGIIRKALFSNPNIDIIVMYFVDMQKITMISQGQTPSVINAHEGVCAHYNINSINLAQEVTDRINNGEFDWETFGGIHPAPFGHEIYANTIRKFLDLSWEEINGIEAKIKAHQLPAEKLDSLCYDRSDMVDVTKAEIKSGWKYDPSWKAQVGKTRTGFCEVPMLVTEEPDAELKLQFKGRGVSVLVVAGPDVGMFEYSIDESAFKSIDQFTQWSSDLNIPWVYTLKTDLSDTIHNVIIRTTYQKNLKSLGYAMRICNFLIN